MDEWLKRSGFFLGNTLLSGMGLAFAIGAPAITEFKAAKKWWIVLWASLLGFYLWSVILSFIAFAVPGSAPLAVFNGISTAASAMLYLHLRDKGRLNERESLIICCVVFLLVVSSGLLSLGSNGLTGPATILSQILSWVFFVLLAWNYRKQHMATTILLLAYANLQLPAGVIGKEGWGNDFVLLLAAKLSLIGAMYHTLGVRDFGK
jgi:hypothetical protein